jgi:hypothetical protein
MTSPFNPGQPKKFSYECLSDVHAAPGHYRIFSSAGTLLYYGIWVNLRTRLHQHKRKGRIKSGRWVAIQVIKSGITAEEFHACFYKWEDHKIEKLDPNLTRLQEGEAKSQAPRPSRSSYKHRRRRQRRHSGNASHHS